MKNNPRFHLRPPQNLPEETKPAIPEWTAPDRGYLDEVVCSIPCYEPASSHIELTAGDLAENVAVFGSIGSGKSTGPLNHILSGAIRFRADNPTEKLGLLVLDLKGDDTVGRVRRLAREAGREDDVRVLDGNGPDRFGLFPSLQEYRDIPEFVAKLNMVSPEMGNENAYWNSSRESVLSSILMLLMAANEELDLSSTIKQLRRYVGLDKRQELHKLEEMTHLRNLAERTDLPEEDRLGFQSAILAIENWAKLDIRTASILASTLSNMITPLLQSRVQDFLGGGIGERPEKNARNGLRIVSPADVVEKGIILVLSIPQQSNPGLSQLLASFVKADFYAAVARRSPAPLSRDRLVLLVMDEYPLVATGMDPRFGDIPVLQTGRSRRLGVVAAMQGVTSLALQIGLPSCDGVLLNMLTKMFMRSDDPRTDHYANVLFGSHTPPPPRRPPHPSNHWKGVGIDEEEAPHVLSPSEAVCPPGKLARLEPYQVLVKSPRIETSTASHWVVPHYIEPLPDLPAHPPAGRRSTYRSLWVEKHLRKILSPPQETIVQSTQQALEANAEALGSQIASAKEAEEERCALIAEAISASCCFTSKIEAEEERCALIAEDQGVVESETEAFTLLRDIRIWVYQAHNPGRGGWAITVEVKPCEYETITGGVFHTTRRRLELLATLAAIEFAQSCPTMKGQPLRIHTESVYIFARLECWIDYPLIYPQLERRLANFELWERLRRWTLDLNMSCQQVRKNDASDCTYYYHRAREAAEAPTMIDEPEFKTK